MAHFSKLDMYYLGQGTHYDIYKKLGAHPITEKGKKAFYHHRDFHKKMIKDIAKDLSEEEMEILCRCLKNLNKFFEPKAGEANEHRREGQYKTRSD